MHARTVSHDTETRASAAARRRPRPAPPRPPRRAAPRARPRAPGESGETERGPPAESAPRFDIHIACYNSQTNSDKLLNRTLYAYPLGSVELSLIWALG